MNRSHSSSITHFAWRAALFPGSNVSDPGAKKTWGSELPPGYGLVRKRCTNSRTNSLGADMFPCFR
jgi:hypothetical protein